MEFLIEYSDKEYILNLVIGICAIIVIRMCVIVLIKICWDILWKVHKNMLIRLDIVKCTER